ncbi:MAG: YfiR family protein, partial [Bacteroidales bacterium]|nr:YfiR family protein [Bacteroidales bacterium]
MERNICITMSSQQAKYPKLTRLIILIGLTIFFTPTRAQNPTDSELKTALIYNFLKFLTHDSLNQKDTIRIGILGDNPNAINAFNAIHEKGINKKKILVTTYDRITEVPTIDVLYVLYEYNFEISKVYKLTQGTNTLLITDRYDEKREVMINFTHNAENQVQFEVNSKNLTEAGFEILPKLLYLGGTELDVRELYINEQERSEQFEQELLNK